MTEPIGRMVYVRDQLSDFLLHPRLSQSELKRTMLKFFAEGLVYMEVNKDGKLCFGLTEKGIIEAEQIIRDLVERKNEHQCV